jgi:Tfp pilus assembly protein PilX
MSIMRPDVRGEEGIAMYIVVMCMMVVLTIGAALSIAGHQSSTAVSDDELGVRALQAAEAGAQAAVHRMNLQQPVDTKCITTTVSNPQSGNSWCAPTGAESVGNRASYSYQTSLPISSGCTGSDFGSSTLQRCIVSTGTAGGIRKRVVQRVVSSTGQDPFPIAGLLGKDFFKAKNNNNIGGVVGTNGQLELGNNSTISGGVQLWQGAPDPIGYSGPVQRNPQPFVLSPPNMLNPATMLDSKTSNDNARLLAGANPADSCSNGSGACYTSGTRTLFMGNNDSVTLGGGVYNFCQINFGNGANVNIAAGATILIYIDSPARPGSGCAAGSGGISTGNNATFSNPSQDPTKLQIVIYGQAPSWPTIDLPNNITVYGAIYAPNTGIKFKNNGNFVGGITAKSIEFKNNAFAWDSRVNNIRLATTLIYYRGSWRQCNSRVSSTTAPATGCL